MLTQQRLKELLHYNQDTGKFTWVNSARDYFNGRNAGTYSKGYFCIRIEGKSYLSHRLAWLYVYGELPNSDLDHINGNPRDNRIKNLRTASKEQNAANKKTYRNNESGVKGVYWHSVNKKWIALIGLNGKQLYLGSFKEFNDAVSAVSAKREELHGEFCRHA